MKRLITSYPLLFGVFIGLLLLIAIFSMVIWVPWIGEDLGRHKRMAQAVVFTAFNFAIFIYALWAQPKPDFLDDNLWPLRAPCIGHFLLFHSCSANSCVAVADPRHIRILRRRFFPVLVNSAVQPRRQACAFHALTGKVGISSPVFGGRSGQAKYCEELYR